MKKIRDYITTLADEYRGHEGLPRLEWRIEGDDRDEGYTSYLSGGVLSIQAANPLGVAYGISQATVFARSGYLADFLGTIKPRFPWRVLSVEHPPEECDAFCQRLIWLGCNAVITDDKSLAESLGSYGLKTIRNFYTSRCLEPDFLSDPLQTYAEHLIGEAKQHEGVFYVPYSPESARCLPRLCDEVGRQTTVTFPAESDGALHPFWESLRQTPYVTPTPLMPLVESPEAAKRILERCNRHNFVGMIYQTDAFDESLWVAIQALWHPHSTQLLKETWQATTTMA